MTRPFLPPSLASLAADGGALAARILAEERLSATAFDAGHARGFAEGAAHGRLEGAAAGRDEAALQAQAASDARGRDGVEVVEAALAALLAARAEDRCGLDAEARAALAVALGVLAPTLFAGTMRAELTAVIAEAIESRGSDTVLLRAAPATLAAIRQDGLSAPPEILRLLPDPTMPPGTAEARWGSGGLLFDAEALTARVRAILGQAPPGSPTSQEYAT